MDIYIKDQYANFSKVENITSVVARVTKELENTTDQELMEKSFWGLKKLHHKIKTTKKLLPPHIPGKATAPRRRALNKQMYRLNKIVKAKKDNGEAPPFRYTDTYENIKKLMDQQQAHADSLSASEAQAIIQEINGEDILTEFYENQEAAATTTAKAQPIAPIEEEEEALEQETQEAATPAAKSSGKTNWPVIAIVLILATLIALYILKNKFKS